METKNTTEIRHGDVLFCHGMIVRVDGEIRETPDGALATDALVLNPDEVRSAGIVPFHWLVREDGSIRWTIKGNALAMWSVASLDGRDLARVPSIRAIAGLASITGYGNANALGLAHARNDEDADFERMERDRIALATRFPGADESGDLSLGYSDGFRRGIAAARLAAATLAQDEEAKRIRDESRTRSEIDAAARLQTETDGESDPDFLVVLPVDGSEDGRMWRVLDVDGNDVGGGLFPTFEDADEVARFERSSRRRIRALVVASFEDDEDATEILFELVRDGDPGERATLALVYRQEVRALVAGSMRDAAATEIDAETDFRLSVNDPRGTRGNAGQMRVDGSGE